MNMHKTLKKRLNALLDLAIPEDISEGSIWYTRARIWIRELHYQTGIPSYKIAGVISALSPMVAWGNTIRQTKELCEAYAFGLTLDNVITSTYKQQRNKAIEILTSDAPDIPAILGKRAYKTLAFYRNLSEWDSQDVTVDTWIYRACDLIIGKKPKTNNDLIQHTIQQIQSERYPHLLPMDLQAIIWIMIKRISDSRTDGNDFKE